MKNYFLVALAALLLAGCQKPADNTRKPSLAWQANDNFSEMEIAKDMDAKVSFNVPEFVSSFRITLSIPSTLVGIANKLIGTPSNKGTATKSPVLDLVNDATAISSLTKIGFLSGPPKNSTSFSLNFTRLLEELASDSILDNASKFIFAISLTDKAGNTLSKDVRFNWTSGPEVVLDPDWLVDLTDDNPSLTMNITAPGKLAKVTLSFIGPLGGYPDTGIIAYIKSFTKGDAVVDLIENATTAKALGLPSGSEVKDKTQIKIDFSTLLLSLSIQASDKGSQTLMTVYLEDALGKETITDVVLSN